MPVKAGRCPGVKGSAQPIARGDQQNALAAFIHKGSLSIFAFVSPSSGGIARALEKVFGNKIYESNRNSGSRAGFRIGDAPVLRLLEETHDEEILDVLCVSSVD